MFHFQDETPEREEIDKLQATLMLKNTEIDKLYKESTSQKTEGSKLRTTLKTVWDENKKLADENMRIVINHIYIYIYNHL